MNTAPEEVDQRPASEPPAEPALSARDLAPILAVTSKLAAPFDLMTMLSEVVSAARHVLDAERGTVWLYEAASDELVLKFAADVASVRIPAGTGIVGTCARSRELINVRDCYADKRFDSSTDKRTGYRTRCMLTLPLIDHKGVLVGVMQVLNKSRGVFEAEDEALATVLAAQCAVALQRVRMTEALIDGERMRQELETAREVQMRTLPSSMPSIPGYDVYGVSRPADLTGGDTFDLSLIDQGLLVVLGDATGHGIGPALSVTQMHAMLRMALRAGVDLETAFQLVNNQLADTLPDDHFITAFIGLLDSSSHRIRFISGGQAPILHFRAAAGTCARHMPTSFPLGAMPLAKARAAVTLEMEPGDLLVLLSDGIYEYRNAYDEEFAPKRVEKMLQAHHDKSTERLSAILFDWVKAFAGKSPQEDDMTVVLVKRQPAAGTEERTFARNFDSIGAIAAWTSAFVARESLDAAVLTAVDLAIEELFTNMVKYSAGSSARVRIRLAKIENGVEVALTDYDVEAFDVTRAPDADTSLPLEERRPGGLGLHLVRKLVDSIEYRYNEELRQSRITFRKTVDRE